ncbi:MAG: BMP family protein [Candidatus Bathyarchaeia archaeon]
MSEKKTSRGLIALLLAIIIIIAAVAVYYATLPPPAPPPPPPKPEIELRVAAVLDTFITEDGWNEAAYNGLMEAKEKYGDRIEIAYTEKVALPDYERVMRDYAEKGYNLIFCHATPAGEAVKSVAKDYPDIWFVWTDGWGEIPPNVVVITPLAHEASYLAGMIAGKMTKSNKIGVVGGMNVPSTYRSFHAFEEAVKVTNPKAEVKVIWVGTFVDIHAGYEAAKSLIAEGCDVVWGNGDSQNVGARFAAVEANVWYIGAVWDESKYAPAQTLTSILWGIDKAFVDIIGKALDSKLEPAKFYEYGMKEGATLAPYYGLESAIPKDVRDKVEEVKQKILAGEFVVPRKDFP